MAHLLNAAQAILGPPGFFKSEGLKIGGIYEFCTQFENWGGASLANLALGRWTPLLRDLSLLPVLWATLSCSAIYVMPVVMGAPPDPGTLLAPAPGTLLAPDPGIGPASDPGTGPAPDPGTGPFVPSLFLGQTRNVSII